MLTTSVSWHSARNTEAPRVKCSQRSKPRSKKSSRPSKPRNGVTESSVHVSALCARVPGVTEAILDLVRAGRPETSDIEEVKKNVSWGPGPRATQALMLGVRARSVIEGRLAPSIDDVLALVHPILRHRMALTFSARAEGITLRGIIDRLCDRIA